MNTINRTCTGQASNFFPGPEGSIDVPHNRHAIFPKRADAIDDNPRFSHCIIHLFKLRDIEGKYRDVGGESVLLRQTLQFLERATAYTKRERASTWMFFEIFCHQRPWRVFNDLLCASSRVRVSHTGKSGCSENQYIYLFTRHAECL
jgi:hypothetical protein